jgi:glucosamine--fructose-6-phosphate aminotransferase (isomerizing)
MCGIIAYLGNDAFSSFVLTGLALLLNRGYDSVGISTIHENQLVTIKHASTQTNNALDTVKTELETVQLTSTIGIGHTRWATHGAKTTMNAHPHHDNSNRISLVHNGIIENYAELKQKLIEEKYTFLSQTDTEVIAVLIGKYLDDGCMIEQALQKTVGLLRGTWALVVIHRDFPNKIWLTRNGSPLLLGIEQGFVMVASESIAFSHYIENYVVLENHDIIEIEHKEGAIHYSDILHRYIVKKTPSAMIETLPAQYPHWMLKEIMEQPDAVLRAMNNKGRIMKDGTIKFGGLERNSDKLTKIRHLILLGCGTSYHAGLWAVDIFKTSKVFQTVQIFDGAEFSENDLPIQPPPLHNTVHKKMRDDIGIIFLSQSGETKDLHRCIEIAKKWHTVKIGVVNVVDSMIARETDCGVYLYAGREVAVASTKSFTNQCVVLAMMSEWFSERMGGVRSDTFYQDLIHLPFHIQQVLDYLDQSRAEMDRILAKWTDKNTLFILGKGSQEAIAKEGALKIKEVSYIHAEGYSSSALKHGAFALIESGVPIILLDIDDEYREKNENAYQEVVGRGADVLVIQCCPRYAETVVTIDRNNTFGAVIANVYLQWISYYLGIKRGNSPDYPRNLAKVVTVE